MADSSSTAAPQPTIHSSRSDSADGVHSFATGVSARNNDGRRAACFGLLLPQLHALLWRQKIGCLRRPIRACCVLAVLPLATLLCGVLVELVDHPHVAPPFAPTRLGAPTLAGLLGAGQPDPRLIAYAPAVPPWTSVMAAFAETSSLPDSQLVGHTSVAELAAALYDDIPTDSLELAVVFHGNGDAVSHGNVSYALAYNGTAGYAGGWGEANESEASMPDLPRAASDPRLMVAASVKLTLDEVLARTYSAPAVAAGGVSFRATVRGFEEAQEFDVSELAKMAEELAVWRVAAPLSSALIVFGIVAMGLGMQRTVAEEVSHGLLRSMQFAGLLDIAYALSWHIPLVLQAIVLSFATALLGVLWGLPNFVGCGVGLWVLMLVPAVLSNVGFALVTATKASTKIRAAVLGLLYVTISLGVHFTLVGLDTALNERTASAFGPSLWDQVYNPAYFRTELYLFANVLPVFHLGKLLDDVWKQVGPQPRGATPIGFDIARQSEFWTDGNAWSPPSPGTSINAMWILWVGYLFMAISASKIAHGGRRLCACLKQNEADTRKAEGELEEAAAAGDTTAAAQLASRRNNSIRIVKMTKAYATGTAVSELDLTIHAGEVLGLLGHNGAGKSTTIGCITGQTSLTFGDAFIRGLSVRHDMAKIQQLLGVCPQHDVLFEELSPRQHFWFWARMRGVSVATVPPRVTSMLEETQLVDKADAPVFALSGGMRRRVSLGNAMLGDAKVLFLDEPTTGMDILVRRVVWRIVQRRKSEGATVVLTTHSMEEAESLADRLAIMSEGRLAATGTSLELKRKFGHGVSVSVTCTVADQSAVEALLRRLLPASNIFCPVPGFLTVGLPKRAFSALPVFLEAAEAGMPHVKDWGLANSTLEEVFIRLTSASKDVAAVLSGEHGAAQRPSLCVICSERSPALVTLTTRSGIEVQSADLVCAICADGAPFPEQENIMPGAETEATSALHDDTVLGSEDLLECEAVDAADAALEKRWQGADNDRSRFSAMVRAVRDSLKSTLCGADRKAQERLPQSEKQCPVLLTPLLVWFYFFVGFGLAVGLCLALGGDNIRQWPDPPDSAKDERGTAYTCSSTATNQEMRGARFSVPAAKLFGCNKTRYVEFLSRQLLSCGADVEASEAGALSLRCVRLQQNTDSFAGFEGVDWSHAAVVRPRRSPTVWLSVRDRNSSLSSCDALSAALTATGATELRILSDRVAAWFNATVLQLRALHSPVQILQCAATENDQHALLGESAWAAVAPSEVAARALWADGVPDIALAVETSDKGTTSMIADIDVSAFLASSDWPDYMTTSPTSAAAYSLLAAGIMYAPNASRLNTPTGRCGRNFLSVESTDAAIGPLWAALHGTTNALVRAAHAESDSGAYSLHSISTTMLQLPSPDFDWSNRAIGSKQDLVVLIFGMFYGIIPTFWLPMVALIVAWDTENRHLMFMRFQGLTNVAYALGTLQVFALLNFGFTMLAVTPPFVIIAATAPWARNIPTLFFLSVFGSVVATAGAVVVARIAGRARNALLLGFCTTLASGALGGCVGVGVEFPWFAMLLWPPLALVQAALRLLQDQDGAGIATTMFVVSGTGVVVTAVLLLLELSPRSLLRLHCAARADQSATIIARRDSAEQKLAVAALLGGESISTVEDEDVLAERTAALSEAALSEAAQANQSDASTRSPLEKWAVRLLNVDKVYPGRKGLGPVHAVRDLTLRIAYGECFGLLGPNGAGKSTAIHLLAGSEAISSGTAFVGGYDCTAETDSVRSCLGVVPQFDALWPQWSPRQHLSTFATMGGLCGAEKVAAVQRVAELIEIGGNTFDLPSKGLSGGQRRRLSLGCALIGNSKVLFLDEPTTGLDPETRMSVWRVINKVRASNRAIVLTTHSLDEADHLCTRLGIMATGELRVLGKPLYLKGKFAATFRLSLIADEGRQTEVEAFIANEISSAARLVSASDRVRSYEIPRFGGGFQMSTAFKRLQESATHAGVAEWSLTQGTLEDVFANVVAQAR